MKPKSMLHWFLAGIVVLLFIGAWWMLGWLIGVVGIQTTMNSILIACPILMVSAFLWWFFALRGARAKTGPEISQE